MSEACNKFYLKNNKKLLQRQKYVFVDNKYWTRFIEKNWHNDVKRDCSIDFSKHRKMKNPLKSQ